MARTKFSGTFARKIVFALVCCAALALSAQQDTPQPLQATQTGQAYVDAVGRRISHDVGYFDPTGAAPPLQTEQKVDNFEDGSSLTSFEIGRTPISIMMIAILIAVLYVVLRFGGSITATVGTQDVNSGRTARGTTDKETPGALEDVGWNTILNMQDRSAALVRLTQAVLRRSVEAHGLLLQRSWTARDALRRLPQTLANRSDLEDLVLAAERVQFGNRTVSEEEFRQHVTRARPLYGGNVK